MQEEESKRVIWSKNNMPFAGVRQKFADIKKEDRSAFRIAMLEVKQILAPPPKLFKKDYPSSGSFSFQSYALYYHSIEKSLSPKAILIHFHGMNGHGASTGYYASVLSQANPGLNVYAFDQLNFGQSEGPFRGHIASLDHSVLQGEAFVAYLLSRFKTKPKVFLSGSSYGGAIVFKMSLNKPEDYSGIVLLGPALRNLSEEKWFMKKFGKFLGFICPRIRTFTETYNSGNKYNMSEYILKDPLIYKDGMVPGSVRTILNAMDEISQLYNKLTVPYIVFQGGVQKMVDLFAPLDLEELSPSPDKTTVYCEKMWHAIFAEEEIEGISWQTSQWLKERI